MRGTQVIMFPGLGATYARMVDKYLSAHPQDAAVLADWSARIDAPLGSDAARGARDAERLKQLEIHALNLLWWRRQRQAATANGAALCGHSLGYYAALVAAGVVDEIDSFRLIDAAFAAGWRAFEASDDQIFVVTATEDVDFERALQGLPVEVLSENSPLQRVLYGPRGQLDAVRDRLAGRLLAASAMSTRVPFHSHRMAASKAEVAQAIDTLGIRPRALRAPLWSHITARPVASGGDALALVLEQLHRPVHWHQLVDALIQAGRFDFIEVGPNRILSQVVRWISPQLEVRFVDHLRRQGVEA